MAPELNASRIAGWLGPAFGVLTAAVGAFLAAGGLWLHVFGASLHYMLVGVGFLVAGALLWRRRTAGAWLAVGVLGAMIGNSLLG